MLSNALNLAYGPIQLRFSDLVQEAARAGYTFRYRGVDQNGRQIYNVKLTPTDYAPLLR